MEREILYWIFENTPFVPPKARGFGVKFIVIENFLENISSSSTLLYSYLVDLVSPFIYGFVDILIFVYYKAICKEIINEVIYEESKYEIKMGVTASVFYLLHLRSKTDDSKSFEGEWRIVSQKCRSFRTLYCYTGKYN